MAKKKSMPAKKSAPKMPKMPAKSKGGMKGGMKGGKGMSGGGMKCP